MPSAAFCAVYRYQHTGGMYTVLYGLSMWSDMHGQNKTACLFQQAA